MIRVLIADDHPVVRAGLKQFLLEASDVSVVGEAAAGRDAIEILRSKRCDVVLLDLALPDTNGLEILKTIKRDFPGTRVLILSIHPEDQYAVRSLKAGASGYLSKESAPRQLLEAIRKVARGGRYITPSVADLLAAGLAEEGGRAAHEALSDREFHVLRRIAAGQNVTEIARELALSVKTISTYRTRILEKLELQTSAELIRYAISHGLVD